ncbi:MAG: diaminopimelate dehydrogenase [Treponema sp.]|nr:diaminopimelate dehydrogenase [Treponema sp.]
MIKIAVVGYGNIGRYAAGAILSAPDMELSGFVRSSDTSPIPEFPGIPVVKTIEELGKIDIAILSLPSRSVKERAVSYLEKGISTVDSYDIHKDIFELRCTLDAAAKKGNARAVVSTGWDPGTNSVIRAILEACTPKGLTYTNFGPGMSMGHTVAVKAIKGVQNALSMTIPIGTGLHRRMVYVQLAAGADFKEVSNAIKTDPYFINDETHVIQVDNVDNYIDMGHGVSLERRGTSGTTPNQTFQFIMRANNPALTSQIMVCTARAALRQAPGAYTLIELPVIDLLPGEREAIIRRLV